MITGPQVAFVDDQEREISRLRETFTEFAGTKFYNADPVNAIYPDKPIDSIEILFLDLYYMSSNFDVELSANWVKRIVPENKDYILIVWSKDTLSHKEELLEVLDKYNLNPSYFETWSKPDYNLRSHDFSTQVSNLLDTISHKNSGALEIDILYGQIIDVEDDGALIKCMINEETPTFQVRKFDSTLLANIKNLNIGTFVSIKIHSDFGTRSISITEVSDDLSAMFEVPDFFDDLRNLPFFNE